MKPVQQYQRLQIPENMQNDVSALKNINLESKNQQ